MAMLSSKDFQKLLASVGLSRSLGSWRSNELRLLVYQELRNFSTFKSSVGTGHYFASQFEPTGFFALLSSISRIRGEMIELP
jgi:hypothetical protein